jgi:glycosyltransferase involved in cell wall biosynthesis
MSAPPRLVLCGDGRSPHTQRWAAAIARRGFDVVVVWRRDQFAEASLVSYPPEVRHEVAGVELAPRRPWREVAARREARRLAGRLRPDVVHGLYLQHHGWTAADFGVKPLVLSGLGSDVMLLDEAPSGSLRARAVQRYLRKRTLSAVRAADLILCDSTDIADRIERLAPEVRTDVIRFGVEPASSMDGCWRERLGIPTSAFIILSTRLFKPNYNIDHVVRAFARVRDALPDAVLVLKEFAPFGDASYRSAIIALVQELGLVASVRHVGELEQDELRALVVAADVLVSVPTTDATAVSVFEAMAARVPVVASRATGIDRDILRHDESAWLVEVGDVKGLADALVALAQDDAARTRLAAGGYAIFERFGDADAEFDRAARLYRELIARRR